MRCRARVIVFEEKNGERDDDELLGTARVAAAHHLETADRDDRRTKTKTKFPKHYIDNITYSIPRAKFLNDGTVSDCETAQENRRVNEVALEKESQSVEPLKPRQFCRIYLSRAPNISNLVVQTHR